MLSTEVFSDRPNSILCITSTQATKFHSVTTDIQTFWILSCTLNVVATTFFFPFLLQQLKLVYRQSWQSDCEDKEWIQFLESKQDQKQTLTCFESWLNAIHKNWELSYKPWFELPILMLVRKVKNRFLKLFLPVNSVVILPENSTVWWTA